MTGPDGASSLPAKSDRPRTQDMKRSFTMHVENRLCRADGKCQSGLFRAFWPGGRTADRNQPLRRSLILCWVNPQPHSRPCPSAKRLAGFLIECSPCQSLLRSGYFTAPLYTSPLLSPEVAGFLHSARYIGMAPIGMLLTRQWSGFRLRRFVPRIILTGDLEG